MPRLVRSAFLITVVTVGFTPSINAQIAGTAIAGVVVDQAGVGTPGAVVSVTSTSTNSSRTVVSAADGRYVVVGLAPGLYRLDVQLEGFKTLTRDGIYLLTGETATVDVQLQLGTLSESVKVAANVPLLSSESAGLGYVVDNRRIVGLPLNGRSFIALANLVPGVALPPPPAAPFPRINGGRPRTNEYLFDGISVLQPEPGQVAFFPNLDAIQEFKIESNSPPAEFGRFNGGVVNLTTKSGSNVLRGTVFEFMRHEALNARNYFAAHTAEEPRFRRNQFGGVVGGPLRHDRSFFFLDYQGQRQTIARTVISTVPTVLQRQGNFTEPIAGRLPVIYDPATTVLLVDSVHRQPFAGSTIPADRIDPVAQALLSRYPLPTSGGTANNYRRADEERNDQDQFSVRIDHRLAGGRDQMFGRLTRFEEVFVPVTPLPDGSGLTTGTPGRQHTTSWSFASSYQRTLTNHLLNELRVGETRRSVHRSAASKTSDVGTLSIPGIPASGSFRDTLPTVVIGGYQQLGSPPNTATDFATGVTQVADTLTWLKGSHTIKLGADVRWSRLNVVQPPSPTGAFTFSSLFTDLPGVTNTGNPFASFLLGQVQLFSIDLQRDEIRNRAHVQEYFAQDDWRVSDRLTLNGGVRYTLNFPSTEQTNQAAVFNLESQLIEYLGRDGRPRSARRLHRLNFGPRVGAIARVSEHTVARAGYGLVWIEMSGITTPFTTPAFPFLQTVSQRTIDNIAPAFVLAAGPTVKPIPLTPDAGVGQGVFAVDRSLGSGYVQQWHVSAQRQIGANVAFEVGYAGSKITRVGVPDANLNQLTVEQLAQGPSLLQRVPNPYYGIVPESSSLGEPTIPVAQLLKPFPQYTTVSLYRNNIGTTVYHGLSTKLEQRFAGGLSYAVSYTRSRLLDDASSVFDASILTGPVASFPVADSFNRRLERDYSNGDIPHVFVASAVWDVPVRVDGRNSVQRALGAVLRDWTLSGVVTLQSGLPLAVTQTTNNNAFAGFGTQRPNLVGDPELAAGERSVQRWFNTAAFAPTPAFSVGSSPRNPIRGPGYRNLDLAVIRRIPLSRVRAIEIRGEVFNVTNSPHFLAPNTTVGSPAFGTITAAGDPRVVQLAVKMYF